MSEIDYYDSDISNQLDNIEKILKTYHQKEASKQRVLLEKCGRDLQNVKMSIDSYNLEVISLGKAPAAIKYKASHKKFEDRMEKVEMTLNSLKDANASKYTLPSFGSNSTGENNANIELILRGHRLQDQSKESLARTKALLEAAHCTADEVILRLDEQEKQIKGITDDVKENQVLIKRADAYLRYFARQIYTDKFLMCLISLIVLAIVVIIGFKIFGGSTEKAGGDKVVLQGSTTGAKAISRLLFETD